MFRPSDGPGVFLRRDDRSRMAVARVRTDVAGFVGIATKGPVGLAVRIETMRQFETVFGSYTGAGFLAYAVRAFFENGGQRCLVVRTASRDPQVGAAPATTTLGVAPQLRIAASSPGNWGNALEVKLAPMWRAETLCPSPPLGGPSLRVVSTQGFARDQLVRLTQPGGLDAFRIVAATDPVQAVLHFVHPDPDRRRPADQMLPALLPSAPVRVERIVLQMAVRWRGRPFSVDNDLGLVPGAGDFIGDAMALQIPQDGIFSAPPPAISVEVSALAAGTAPELPTAGLGDWLRLSGGRDGLAGLTSDDFITALDVLEREPDVSILAIPDIVVAPVRPLFVPIVHPRPDPCAICPAPAPATSPQPMPEQELPPAFALEAIHRVQAAMVDQCERLRDRIALVDPPSATVRDPRIGAGPILGWRQRFDSAFGALLFPWIEVADPLGVAPVRAIPPSGHVAGKMAATDLAVGPHRAPANLPLAWALAASLPVDPATHGLLNDAGIEALVARDGRPLRLMGARSMSSDPDWRFLPVRRLISMLRRALDAATQWAVFEPNDAETRALLVQSIGAFLESLRKGGALAGDAPATAWRVRCDETNNPASARARGQLVVDVAVAPAQPLEFIVLRLGRSDATFELAEHGPLTLAQAGAA